MDPEENEEVNDETQGAGADTTRDDDPPHPEPEGEGEDEAADDGNPLHVALKVAHAEELIENLTTRGYRELATALSEADVGDVIEITIVED